MYFRAEIAVLVTFIAGTAYLGMSQRLFVQEVDGRRSARFPILKRSESHPKQHEG